MRRWLLQRISFGSECGLFRRLHCVDRAAPGIFHGRAFSSSWSVAAHCDGNQDGNENDSESGEPGFAWKLAARAAKVETPALNDLCNRIAELRAKDSRHAVPMIKEWAQQGNVLDKETVRAIMVKLRQWKRGALALEVADWIHFTRPFPLDYEDAILRMDMCVRAGKIDRAQSIFKRLLAREQTVDAYNTMFLLFSHRKMILHADDYYYKFRTARLKPTDFTFSILASLYRRCGLHTRVVKLQEDIKAAGMEPSDCYLNNLMVSLYELKGIAAAEEIFQRLVPPSSELKRGHLPTYSMMAASYLSAGMPDKARSLMEVIEKGVDDGTLVKLRRTYHVLISMYSTMKEREAMNRLWTKIEEPRGRDYVAMIESCGRAGDVKSAVKFFREADTRGFLNQTSIFAALLCVYAGEALADDAEKLFKKMKERDVLRDALCYHYLVLVNIKAKRIARAVEVLELTEVAGMRDGRAKPFVGTLCDVLKAIAENSGDVELAETVLADWRKAKFRTDIAVYNHLLRVYLKAGKRVEGSFIKRLAGNNMRPTHETYTLLNQIEESGGEVVTGGYYL